MCRGRPKHKLSSKLLECPRSESWGIQWKIRCLCAGDGRAVGEIATVSDGIQQQTADWSRFWRESGLSQTQGKTEQVVITCVQRSRPHLAKPDLANFVLGGVVFVVGARRVGGQNFALFFSRRKFNSFFSLWRVSSRFKAMAHPKCGFRLVSFCVSPGCRNQFSEDHRDSPVEARR